MRVITRQRLEAALAAIESRLAVESDALDLLADRARILTELGRTDEAKRQYLEILKRDARHLAALIDFSLLLYHTGFTTAARTAATAAVAFHPDNPKAQTHFADLAVFDQKFDVARVHYETALRIDPGYRDAHRGLAIVFWELGDEKQAAHHRDIQYKDRPVEMLPYLGTGEPVPILVLMSARGGNLPWRDLIDSREFLIVTLAPEYFDRSKPLPAHRLVFNTIGDADICRDALETASTLLKRTTAPLINSPSAVLATGRMANAERFGRVPGVVTPRMVCLPRLLLCTPGGPAAIAEHGLSFPLLLRRPGFHTGQHFVLVESPAELATAAAGLPGDEVIAIRYLDARGPDGKARKYRVMTIGGRLYPWHLAISSDWQVHYFTAEMSKHAEHQAEEAAFLNDMPRVVGQSGLRALEQISAMLGLDYGGIDFGLGPNGEVLFFEANATMVMYPPDAAPQWDYRRASMGRAIDAARSMLPERAGFKARKAA
jgi:hypothetical protein